MAKHQVKFYVDDDEKRRLEVLAQLRHMTIPNYVKLTDLEVKVQQFKEIYVESGNLLYPEQEDKIYIDAEIVLSIEEIAFFVI